MSKTKKALIVLGIWLGVGLVVAIALIPSAQAHDEDHQEGAVAVCNWENFEQYGHDGYNWRWMGCNYSLFGRVQCRGENIPDCWTVAEARRDVRAFRAYTGLG